MNLDGPLNLLERGSRENEHVSMVGGKRVLYRLFFILSRCLSRALSCCLVISSKSLSVPPPSARAIDDSNGATLTKDEEEGKSRSMEVVSGTTVGLKERAAVLNGFCPLIDREEKEKEEGLSTETESSSIGVASLSDNDDEVQSQLKDNPLQSLGSLEDSLPIKSGLSNFFTGKSKSFASLPKVASSSSDELAKPVNPFNKRRRVLLLACKNSRSRRASYSSLLPLQPQTTAKDGEEEDNSDCGGDSSFSSPPHPMGHRRHLHDGRNEVKELRSSNASRCFSLSDLQHA